MPHVLRIPHNIPVVGDLTRFVREQPKPKPNPYGMFSPTAQRLFQSPTVQQHLQTGAQVRYQKSPSGNINYTAIPQVLGVSTSQLPPAASGGGGAPPPSTLPTQQQVPSSPEQLFEQAPSSPSFEEQYGSLFDQALSTLDAQIEARRQESQVDISGIEQKTGRLREDIKGQLATGEQQYQTQEQKQIHKETETDAELRRQFSELQQGIYSRYGRRGSAGIAASEILGRETMRLISQNRQATQNTLNDIFLAKAGTISEANRRLFDIDTQSEQLRKEAKIQFEKDRTDLLYKRGQLAVDRNRQILDAYKNYEDVIRSVNQRNTAFKQKLFQDQQEFERKLQLKKFDIVNEYSTDLTNRLTGLIKSGTLSEEGLRGAEKQLGLASGTLQLPQRLSTEDDEEKRRARLRKIAGFKIK